MIILNSVVSVSQFEFVQFSRCQHYWCRYFSLLTREHYSFDSISDVWRTLFALQIGTRTLSYPSLTCRVKCIHGQIDYSDVFTVPKRLASVFRQSCGLS